MTATLAGPLAVVGRRGRHGAARPGPADVDARARRARRGAAAAMAPPRRARAGGRPAPRRERRRARRGRARRDDHGRAGQAHAARRPRGGRPDRRHRAAVRRGGGPARRRGPADGRRAGRRRAARRTRAASRPASWSRSRRSTTRRSSSSTRSARRSPPATPSCSSPPGATPLTARFLVERLARRRRARRARCSASPGRAPTVGAALCADPRVRKISFTGSEAVGHAIARAAGREAAHLRARLQRRAGRARRRRPRARRRRDRVQRLHERRPELRVDAAGARRASACATSCSTRLLARVDALRPGDPADPATDLAPVIDEREAQRASRAGSRDGRAASCCAAARRDGALVAAGGGARARARGARVWRDELFGPAVASSGARDDDDALALANDTRFGLAMSVMTRDLDRALRFAARPASRPRARQPAARRHVARRHHAVGRLRRQRLRQGGRARRVRDMTEEKLVVIHPGTA